MFGWFKRKATNIPEPKFKAGDKVYILLTHTKSVVDGEVKTGRFDRNEKEWGYVVNCTGIPCLKLHPENDLVLMPESGGVYNDNP